MRKTVRRFLYLVQIFIVFLSGRPGVAAPKPAPKATPAARKAPVRAAPAKPAAPQRPAQAPRTQQPTAKPPAAPRPAPAAPTPPPASGGVRENPMLSLPAPVSGAGGAPSAAASGSKEVEVRGQVRNLNMLLVLKNKRDSMSGMELRKDYKREIKKTPY